MLPRLARRLAPLASGATGPAGEAPAALAAADGARRWTQADAGRSMLGGAGPAATSVMEEAATARLKKIKSQLEATGELRHEPGPPSVLGGVLRFVWNTLLVGGASLGAAAAYYTYAYTPRELDEMLKKARADGAVAGAPPPPLTSAWADLMERYLETRRSLESKVREFTDPSYDRLLPDLPPNLRGQIITLVLDLDEVSRACVPAPNRAPCGAWQPGHG